MDRYICTTNGSNKFWEIDRKGASLTIRFGKIGTDGQTQVKKLASPDAARDKHRDLVFEKLSKGYVKDGGKASKKSAKPPAKAKHPFLFYGVHPLNFAEGANCGHGYLLLFESAPSAAAKKQAEKAFVRAAGYNMDTKCPPWKWDGAWAMLFVGQRYLEDPDEWFPFDDFFAEIGKALLAVHKAAPLREVVYMNALAGSKSPWEKWTLATQPKPTPAPAFGGQRALHFT